MKRKGRYYHIYTFLFLHLINHSLLSTLANASTGEEDDMLSAFNVTSSTLGNNKTSPNQNNERQAITQENLEDFYDETLSLLNSLLKKKNSTNNISKGNESNSLRNNENDVQDTSPLPPYKTRQDKQEKQHFKPKNNLKENKVSSNVSHDQQENSTYGVYKTEVKAKDYEALNKNGLSFSTAQKTKNVFYVDNKRSSKRTHDSEVNTYSSKQNVSNINKHYVKKDQNKIISSNIQVKNPDNKETTADEDFKKLNHSLNSLNNSVTTVSDRQHDFANYSLVKERDYSTEIEENKIKVMAPILKEFLNSSSKVKSKDKISRNINTNFKRNQTSPLGRNNTRYSSHSSKVVNLIKQSDNPLTRKTDNGRDYQDSEVGVKKDETNTRLQDIKTCLTSEIQHNYTFSYGIKAGRFVPDYKARNMDECVYHCCSKHGECDVAFMIKENCFHISCYEKALCRSRRAHALDYSPQLAYVSNQPTYKQASTSSYHQKELKKQCRNYNILRNMTFKSGLDAGHFTPHGEVKHLNECVEKCCTEESCDAILMLNTLCYTIKCNSIDSCRPTTRGDLGTTTIISFVSRGNKLLGSVKNVEKKNTPLKIHGVCNNAKLSPVFKNVKLSGGFKSGSFKNQGLVTNYEECVTYCCQDNSCNMALMLKNNCFLVFCKTYKSCATYPVENDLFDAKIVYVNWKEPNNKVITQGNLLYKDLGCWRSDFGSLQTFEEPQGVFSNNPFDSRNHAENNCGNIAKKGFHNTEECWQQTHEDFTTLESKDESLMGTYKKRYDAFLKCGNVAQQQGFTIFALQDGGKCFGGKKLTSNYNKYGVSRHCKQGLGSDHAKNIYEIVGSKNLADNSYDDKSLFVSTTSGYNREQLMSVNHKKLKTREKKQSLYRASEVRNHVFVSGLKAGKFTSVGAVKNMDECIKYCGGKMNCSAAFMVQKYCFTVECFTKKSCSSQPAATSIFHPRLSFITHLTTTKNNTIETESAKLTRRCKALNVYENVTLFGGINAGQFTDLGGSDTMEDCIKKCCVHDLCDVAFMLGNDCYGVHCKNKQSCGTKPAKHADKYQPRIAYLTSFKNTSESADSSSSCWNGTILTNYTLIGGMEAGVFYSNGNTDTMTDCMKYCCQQKDCDVAFRINKGCYTIRCKNKQQCQARKARRSQYIPQIAYNAIFLHQKNDVMMGSTKITNFQQKSVSETVKKKKKGKHNSSDNVHSKMRHGSCKVGPILYNVTLKMGMHSGIFKKLGQVDKMKDCISMCCKEKESNAAFMFGKRCYSVKCYNENLCEIRPAFVSNINTLNINPAVAFLHVTTDITHIDYSKSEIEKSCVASNIVENVTLLGGEKAGNFIDNGERRTIEECITACCEIASCDIAFMSNTRCFSVSCNNETLCQAITSESNSNMKIAYVSRNTKPQDQELELKLSSSNSCPYESLNKLKIHRNKTLLGGFESGNYTFLGRTKYMDICMAKCCSHGNCDVAYSIDDNCYGIKCFSNHVCHIDDRTPETTSTKIAIIKDVKVATSFKSRYLKFWLPVVSGLVAVIIMIAWVYWLRLRNSDKNYEE